MALASSCEEVLGMQATFRAAEEEQRQIIAKHGPELSLDALNDMKVCSAAIGRPGSFEATLCIVM